MTGARYGSKTHEQQWRIIEKRENTKNAGDDFNAEEKLKRSKQEREARQDSASLRDEGVELTDKDDRQMICGENQESARHWPKPGG